jgi:hypothetical protein
LDSRGEYLNNIGDNEVKRPDEEHFLRHSEHFLIIDQELENFCLRQGFTLDKNLYRTPCRVLRRKGNPELVIDIYQETDWVKTEYYESLPHTFAVAAYYETPPANNYIYKLEALLGEHEQFTVIAENLQNYLARGLHIFSSWTPDIFLQEGLLIENLRKQFGEG